MNFFESQERVRKNTTLLVVLFALAVVALIVMANVLVMLVFGFISSTQLRDGQALVQQMDWATFAAVGAGVCAVVLAGSIYKMVALSAGGKVVAESLGGQLLAQNSQDLNQRKLLNVVEEMAIASGTPVPPVYLLVDEPGINAFAAGFSPRDAVIGVTQGAIEHLNREQLQGVIAHEFSHIFNGDMRLNIRLMGVLNGILVLGIIGYFLLRAAPFSGRRRGNDKGGAGILALALGLMAIGFAGTFFGNLIKASVSRQREYLADASAVQFTRNPNGIAGALKKIGGLAYGSSVRSPGAAEVSHAFFAKGISGFTQWLSATHPPLEKRIRRIDPQWDGLFDVSEAPAESANGRESGSENAAQRPSAGKRVGTVGTMTAGSVAAELMAVMAQVGQPQPQAVDYARALLAELPAPIQNAAREPYGARAIVYALLLDKGEAIRTRQLKQLQAYADPDVFALTRALMPPIDALDVRFRLPIIDIAIPALKQLSAAQYRSFKDNLLALIEMDARVDLMEWSLQKILFRHLDSQFFKHVPTKARYAGFEHLTTEAGIVLSVLAHAGAESGGDGDALGAFQASLRALGADGPTLSAIGQIGIADLDRALVKLDELQAPAKSRFLTACVASIWHDRLASPAEIELLRAFASVLDCPIPPPPAVAA